MILFAGALIIFTGVVGMVRIVCSTAACSSLDLKQFEHKSFFHAFCMKRGHCVDAIINYELISYGNSFQTRSVAG